MSNRLAWIGAVQGQFEEIVKVGGDDHGPVVEISGQSEDRLVISEKGMFGDLQKAHDLPLHSRGVG